MKLLCALLTAHAKSEITVSSNQDIVCPLRGKKEKKCTNFYFTYLYCMMIVG
jgi:hypothetical protein